MRPIPVDSEVRSRPIQIERLGDERSSDERLFDDDTKSLVSSLIVHLLLLIPIGMWHLQPLLDQDVTLLVVPEEQVKPDVEEFEMVVDVSVSEELLEDVGAASLGTVEAAAPLVLGEVMEAPELKQLELAHQPVELSAVNDVLADLFSNDDRNHLLEDVAGIQGTIVRAKGDRGSVDRLTQEILTRLEESPVLVVWLMDASESLRPRRAAIIEHFTRVYDELDALAADRGDSLLTSIASFGRGMEVMTPAPTADREAIQTAVNNIQADESGVENVFTAIKGVTATYADVTDTGRKVMIVVVTDERGNDTTKVDEALTMVQNRQMSVYVIGPIAPFARSEVEVEWKDPLTAQRHYLPVDLGPETAFVEHPRLAVWEDGPGADPVSSGFGPHGLTRITHANGGLYLLSDDSQMSDPDLDTQNLRPYRPEYGSAKEYEKMAQSNPARLAVLRTAQATDELLKDDLPRTFLSAGIQFDIKVAKKKVARALDVINRGLNELAAAADARKRETSPRWQAHYDLLVGRLLANRVRCYSSVQMFDAMYNDPQMPIDGTKNAWTLGEPEQVEQAVAALPDELRQDFEQARKQLQQVIDDHTGTPWAAIAAAELGFPLAFQWREDFMEPPEGVPLPWDLKPWDELTEAQKEAKLAFDKKKAARAKRKQEQAEKGEEAKPPPNL